MAMSNEEIGRIAAQEAREQTLARMKQRKGEEKEMVYSQNLSQAYDGRILDTSPMADGNPALVFDPDEPELGWVEFEGTFGELGHSMPLSAEDVRKLIAGTYKKEPLSYQYG
jgi:hypothetical protein